MGFVTPGQLCEHLTPAGIGYITSKSSFKSIILINRVTLVIDPSESVRIDKVEGGYRVVYGDWRKLRELEPSMV